MGRCVWAGGGAAPSWGSRVAPPGGRGGPAEQGGGQPASRDPSLGREGWSPSPAAPSPEGARLRGRWPPAGAEEEAGPRGGQPRRAACGGRRRVRVPPAGAAGAAAPQPFPGRGFGGCPAPPAPSAALRGGERGLSPFLAVSSASSSRWPCRKRESGLGVPWEGAGLSPGLPAVERRPRQHRRGAALPRAAEPSALPRPPCRAPRLRPGLETPRHLCPFGAAGNLRVCSTAGIKTHLNRQRSSLNPWCPLSAEGTVFGLVCSQQARHPAVSLAFTSGEQLSSMRRRTRL